MVSIDHSKDVVTKSSLRSVKFKETPTLILLPDDADTKAARRGPWEMLARDGARFKRRIKQTEDAISWIFEQTHRDKARAAGDGSDRLHRVPPGRPRYLRVDEYESRAIRVGNSSQAVSKRPSVRVTKV